MTARWWVGRTRQALRHVRGRVSAAEREALAAWLTPGQLALFDAMHPADRRHGLDVLAALRAAGHRQPDLLLAGLFHDASKGHAVRLWHRAVWALGDQYGAALVRAGARLPGWAGPLERIRVHPEESARLALAAGCTERTAELIRHQSAPDDPELGRALLLADQAN